MSTYLVRLEEFKHDLTALDADTIAEKYLFTKGSVVLGNEREIQLCDDIAQRFGTTKENIHVVGSAKLGFTIKPGDRFRSFGNSSDIDVVIINEALFQAIWTEAFHFANCGGYWQKQDEFKHYLFQGWIRPDKLPNGGSFKITKDWTQYFRNLTYSEKYGRYPIKAGLYNKHAFAKGYHRRCIDSCKEEVG